MGGTLGVLLVAGMLTVQQVGDLWASRERSVAATKEHLVVEALRAAKDLKATCGLKNREMRLAIAPSDVARALEMLRAAANSAENHITSARNFAEDDADKATFDALDKLTKDYVDVSVDLAAALRDYGDTVEKVRGAVAIGNQMTALIDKSAAARLAAADAGNEHANIESARVGFINLGIGLFVVIVLAGVAVFRRTRHSAGRSGSHRGCFATIGSRQ